MTSSIGGKTGPRVLTTNGRAGRASKSCRLGLILSVAPGSKVPVVTGRLAQALKQRPEPGPPTPDRRSGMEVLVGVALLLVAGAELIGMWEL